MTYRYHDRRPTQQRSESRLRQSPHPLRAHCALAPSAVPWAPAAWRGGLLPRAGGGAARHRQAELPHGAGRVDGAGRRQRQCGGGGAAASGVRVHGAGEQQLVMVTQVMVDRMEFSAFCCGFNTFVGAWQ